MSDLIEEIIVGITTLKVKFLKTLKVTSITNSNFQLIESSATPILSPFKPIDVEEDYNTISRMLILKYTAPLKADADYEFTVSELLSATGILLDPESATFTTGTQTIPSLEEILEASSDEPPVEIVDHSIKSAVFSSSDTIISSNPDFYILDTDPDLDNTITTTDYNNGRITIKFSSFPANTFINDSYFTAQRKLLGRGFNRWNTVTTIVSISNEKPWVFIDFPSNDAAPVYNTSDHTYFEEGYKYRIKVSKAISI